jgi:hypothetical protein
LLPATDKDNYNHAIRLADFGLLMAIARFGEAYTGGVAMPVPDYSASTSI